MSKPLITIITSTLNVEMEIPNLINSLLIQKYQNFEWLIIDGGSSDNTLEKLNCISKANLICSAKDSGIYDAWNKGLKFAKGEWVIFLGADDELYDENVFKNFYNFTRNISKDIEIIYGKVFSNSQIFGKEINNLKEEIVKYMCICHQATFHRNTLFKKLGFNVSAITGKLDQEEFLKSLGANEVIDRNTLDLDLISPLQKPRYSGGIDAVGGKILSNLICSTSQRAAIACCGMVGGLSLDTSIFPFILRGLSLFGIDSAESLIDVKEEIWKNFSSIWKLENIDENIKDISLDELPGEIDRILKGDQIGRVRVVYD